MSPLPDQVRSTLHAAAVAVAFPPPGFDPDKEPLVALPDEAGAGRRRPRGTAVQVAAVVLAVVAVATAVLVARRDGGDGDRSVESGVTPAAGLPDGVRAPSWVPDGMSLVSVAWTTAGEAENANAGHFQLFEAPTGGGRLVVWAAQGDIQPSPTPGATVRGQPAQLEDMDDLTWVIWLEDGVPMILWASGMPAADALAFVDGLVPRPGGLRNGFEPPAGAGLELVDEGEEPATIPARLRSTLVYTGPDDGEQLVLEAMSPLDPPAPYLAAVMEMNGAADMVENPVGPDSGAILTAPDQTRVRVDVVGDWSLPATEVQRLLGSYRAVTPGELAGMVDEADAGAGALPLVATAELPSATVELRDGGGYHVLCLRLPGEDERRCAGLDTWSARGDTGGLGPGTFASLAVGDAWYVVAAATWDDTTADMDLALFSPSQLQSFPQERAVVGDWTIVLALVPVGTDEVGAMPWPDVLGRPPVVDAAG